MSQAGILGAEANNPHIPTLFVTDLGNAVPLANTLDILGTNGVTTSGSGKTVTVTVLTATSGADAGSATKGVSSFDNTHFTVTNGFVQLIGGGAGIDTVITDDGSPGIVGNASGAISLLGSNGIVTSGQGPANTATITALNATVAQIGVVEMATNSEVITGTVATNKAINPVGLKAKLGTQTAQGVMISKGTNEAIESTAAGTTGQLLIGATGANPAFGSTAYADFSFSNISSVATPRTVSIVNTDVNAASHADLRLSTPPLGGDSLISWEVQGSHFFAVGIDNQVAGDPWKLSNSSHPSAGTAAIAVDATTAAVKFANAYEFPIADGTINQVLKTDGAGNLDFASVASLTVEEQQIFYVGKHGNDANTGLNIENAFLTFGAAITEASGETPSAVNRFSIVCLDDGIYTENITTVQYVDIYAPNAKLIGTMTIVDDVNVKFRSQDVATGTIGTTKTAGTSYSFIEIDLVTCTGTGIGALCTSGFINYTWKTMYIENGFGIGDLTSATAHMHIKGGDIYITGTGTGIVRANAGSTLGRLDHIIDIGGGNGVGLNCVLGAMDLVISRIEDVATGIDANGGTINLFIGLLSATAAYDIAAGATLNLNVNSLVGTETNAGTLSLFRGDGTSRTNDIISTGLTDTSRTEHAISIYGAGGVLSEVGPLTNGQLVVGSTGVAPVAASLTSTGGTLTITPGAGTINLEANAVDRIVQVVNASTSALVTCTTVIPVDDTIPQQSTEGDLVISLAITPTNASNYLLIQFSSFAAATTPQTIPTAIFQDAIENALSVTCGYTSDTVVDDLSVSHYMVAGTVSATTFKIHIGPQTLGQSIYVNGAAGSRLFGGVSSTSLTITEIKA